MRFGRGMKQSTTTATTIGRFGGRVAIAFKKPRSSHVTVWSLFSLRKFIVFAYLVQTYLWGIINCNCRMQREVCEKVGIALEGEPERPIHAAKPWNSSGCFQLESLHLIVSRVALIASTTTWNCHRVSLLWLDSSSSRLCPVTGLRDDGLV